MIRLTRLNGQPIAVNSDLIKFVENAHDTVLTLLNSEKVIVRESTDEVIGRIVEFRRTLLAGFPVDRTTAPVGAALPPNGDRPLNSDLTPERTRRG
jgi:uncharacterized protein YlzI (FlbEa/FlbD family)